VTKLGSVIRERGVNYSTLAERAHLQPRTIRQLAMGETPIDNVAVGTVRKIASALGIPMGLLLEEEALHPGDPSRSRAERLSDAVRLAMWSGAAAAYPSPVETGVRDDIADTTPDELFKGMTTINARRG
jgi:transcriptional regulator with XRE-family HTH domain